MGLHEKGKVEMEDQDCILLELKLDHISDVFNAMHTKKDQGVHFILAGDTNELKLNSIISLSPQMKQIVT